MALGPPKVLPKFPTQTWHFSVLAWNISFFGDLAILPPPFQAKYCSLPSAAEWENCLVSCASK